MKKLTLIAIISASLIILSCGKYESTNSTTHTWNPDSSKISQDAIATKLLGSIEVTLKCGHDFKECAGVGEWCFNSMFFYRCHIPCIGFGDNCTVKIKLGKGVANKDGSHHEGDTDYLNFSSEPDTLYVAPIDGASIPERNVWKSFSIKPATSGYSKYINIIAQDTDIQHTTDGTIYYKLQNVTYTTQATFSEIY